jgi:hypothetical protein
MGTLPHYAFFVLAPRLACLCTLSLCGCGVSSESCADETYVDTIQIQFAPELTQSGDYQLNFASGPVNGSCNVTVGGTVIEPCTSSHLSVEGKDSSGLVVLSTLRAWFDYAPFTFDLSLAKDDVNLTTQTITPQFVEDEPNGKGCGIQRQAVVPLTVSQ